MAKVRIKKVQSKVPVELVKHIEKQEDFVSMNSYIKEAITEKSNFGLTRKQK